MRRFTLCLLLCWTAVTAYAAEVPTWTNSIVVIESNIVDYSFYEPWSSSSRTITKNGIAVDNHRILTTADWMQNSTHVRVQKDGRGRWWNAEIEWVDYHANLAVLAVGDDTFWQDLVSAPFTRSIPRHGSVQIYRQSGGNLESWQAAVSKVFVTTSQRSFVRHMMLELQSDVDSSGWSEVVVRDGEVVGLVASQDRDRLLVIPAPLILDVLDAKSRNPDAGLSYYDFVWQTTRNQSVSTYLGLEGEARGVVVTSVPDNSAFAGILQPHDIILEIDGFQIDGDADYLDPLYGHLSFRNLATRQRFAGEQSVFTLWRDGTVMDVSVELPKASYDSELVPDQIFDRDPEYLIAGGFIFQPLSASYLRSWGKEWWKSAPYRLGYYNHEKPTPQRPHLVILSHLLPDRFNLGYQELTYMAVDKVNGHFITDMRSLQAALEQPAGEYHVIEFFPNSATRKVVLDAATLEAATNRIIANYGIQRAQVIH